MKKKLNAFGKKIKDNALCVGIGCGAIVMFPVLLMSSAMSSMNGNGIGEGLALVAVGTIITSPLWGPFWLLGKGMEWITGEKVKT